MLRRITASLPSHPTQVRRLIDADPLHLEGLLGVLRTHHDDWPLLVRVCFILGNLSAANPSTREAMAPALPQLLSLLRLHERALPPTPSGRDSKENCAPGERGEAEAEEGGGGDGKGERKEVQTERFDVLVKLIRLIAHM